MSNNDLYNTALDACKLSYAPYSNINVGAVALLDDQTLVCAANFENISSPACICAEQSLVGTLNNLHHGKRIISIAVAAKHNDGVINISPCGVCRQILSECETKQKSNISLIFYNNDKLISTTSVDDILPYAFK